MDYNEAMPLAEVAVESPLGSESLDAGLARFATVEDMVKILRPSQSVRCMHPETLAERAALFLDHFPGLSFYAVKANPDPYVLQRLFAAGIRHFDVASLGEVKSLRELFPSAHLAFMNPVKSREAIRKAYFEYGVRDFVIDTFEELHKILEETKVAADLSIIVRLAMPKGSAACQLTGKFGCLPDVAVSLLRDANKVAHKVGISFHVGSQTLEPGSYVEAIRKAGEVIRESGVSVDVFDVGGGFPIGNLGMDVPPLTDYCDAIRQEIAALKLPKSCQIWSEPGRALSGACETLVVRVELRKGDVLHINDGSFGNMFEVCSMNWKNTVHLIRPGRRGRKTMTKAHTPFRFYGPTCDSVDYMAGPFLLPEDVCEGDWIAIRGMGAYGAASQSHFNGFHSDFQVEISHESASAAPIKRRTARTGHLKLVKSDQTVEQ